LKNFDFREKKKVERSCYVPHTSGKLQSKISRQKWTNFAQKLWLDELYVKKMLENFKEMHFSLKIV